MENNNPQEAPAIYWRIDEWFPDLSPEVKSGLKTYHEELVKFNRTLSLISPKSMPVADALHFADSIQAVSIVTATHPEIDKIFDLGSGSGFPGVVFAIMNPKIQVVLVEIDKKKAEFLSHIVSVLGLENAKVENRNIEALEANSVEYAIVRGFANISKTILSARQFMKKGGHLFHMKGEEWGIEVGGIPSQLCSIWSPALVGEYKLPVGAIKFAVVKTDKIA